MNKTRALFLALFALLLAARLCHTGILWAEETLPLAAAQQMRAGKVLYRGIWFDKPPAAPVLYRLLGGEAGAVLRAAGALYGLLSCWLAFAFARDLWGEREGRWAAALLGIFLVFDFPSSVIPLAADLLMLAPHLAAVWMAWRRRAVIAGALAGIAFAVNPKGLLVLAVCAVWTPSLGLVAGFAAVTAIASGWMWAAGALAGYWDEVWRWGRAYAGTTFVENPVRNGIVRTLNWAGFHAGIVIAAGVGMRKEAKARWAVWLAVSVVGVAAGLRFFPRYYFELLPAVVLLAARGFAIAPRKYMWMMSALLIVPVARFAPTYVTAARGSAWRDTAMDRDSRAVASILARQAKPGDTLFVWGYRPEIYVYSHLPAASRFLDSQPLTGVPADRHLTQSTPVETVEARARRAELARTAPDFVVDGLGGYNARLGIGAFADLRAWIAGYREIGRTGESVVYRRALSPR